MITISFLKFVARKFPNLPDQLRKARMPYSPEEFIRRTMLSTLYVSFGIVFIFFLLLANVLTKEKLILSLLIAIPLVFAVLFFYFLQLPFVKINRIDRDINKEIIYAGRFLVVELESGVTLYDAMKNLVKSYPITGSYFMEVIYKIDIGTQIEDAIKESIENCPSNSLTKILWQISNSLRTGSNIALPLKTVVDTFIREQPNSFS